MTNCHLYNRRDYFLYLIESFQRAGKGDRLVLASMEFRPDQELISQIVDELCGAARRGADVSFLVDAYSFMLREGSPPGPVFFIPRDPKQGYGEFKSVIAAINRLRDSGAECTIMNKPVRALKNPWAGRAHLKYAVINDEVFVGGCNLGDVEMLDVMVKTANKRLADFLIAVTHDIHAHGNVRKALAQNDQVFKVDEETVLLIDAGVRRQSIIYDKALELITRAKERVYMTSQYFPNTYTPAALAKATERGVRVHLSYNHHEHLPAPLRAVQKRTVAFKKKRLPLSLFENELDTSNSYLHAKILLNEAEGIIGSHNFVKFGVSLGTAEIALHSRSPDFIKAARDWIDSL